MDGDPTAGATCSMTRPTPMGPTLPTDRLIAALAVDLRASAGPGLRTRLSRAAAIGAAASAVLVGLARGARPDLTQAAFATALVVKIVFAVALCALALRAAESLSRPGSGDAGKSAAIALPVALVGAVGLGQWMGAAPDARASLVMGGSAGACLAWILVLSAAPLWGLLAVMRGEATTRPRLAGAVLGVAAGAAGAAAYAFFCAETAMPFVGVWYTLGVTVSAVAGTVAGGRLLRW